MHWQKFRVESGCPCHVTVHSEQSEALPCNEQQGVRFILPGTRHSVHWPVSPRHHPNEPGHFKELSILLMHRECLQQVKKKNEQPNSQQAPSSQHRIPQALPVFCYLCTALLKLKGKAKMEQRTWQAQAGSDEEIKRSAPNYGSEFSERACFPGPGTEGCPPG